MKKVCCLVSIISISAFSYANDRFIQGSGSQDGCMIDSKSNLMLAKNPDITKLSWYDANKYVKGLKLCGFNDWRLPTRQEQIKLQSDIGNYAAFAWFNTHGFNNIQTDFYWSKDTYIKNNNDAWGIYMYSSKVYNEPKSSLNYAWPVRNNAK